MQAKSMFASVLISVLVLYSAVLRAEAAQTGQQIYTVKRSSVPVAINIAGTVAARKTVQLTAQIPGRIDYIAGKEGDHFRTGQVLVSIDDNALRAKLEAASAQRDAAYAAIRNANVQLHREVATPRSDAGTAAPGGMGMPAMMDQMFTNPMQNIMGMRDRGAERSSDLVSRETQLAQANTQYKQAEAQMKEIQASLRDARSMAPFSGVIEYVYVERGDTVQPGQPILNYSETGAYQVQADVPVRLRSGLREGMQLPIITDDNQAVSASISRIFPVANPEDHTVRVELDLPTSIRATAGMYAEVSVPDTSSRGRTSIVIPQSAVITKGGLPLVFSVGEDGKARLRVVRLGEATANNMIVVLSGVKEMDRIIANPAPGLRAGTQVIEKAEEQAPTNN